MPPFPSVEELRSWADGLEEIQERLAPSLPAPSPANARWPICAA